MQVVVDKVQDVIIQVPLTNTKVQLVGKAVGTFLAWPTHLIRLVSKRPQVLNYLIFYLLVIVITFINIKLTFYFCL